MVSYAAWLASKCHCNLAGTRTELESLLQQIRHSGWGATFGIWSSGIKNPYFKYASSPFFNFGSFITFGPLGRRCLLLNTVHIFAVITISLHIRKYATLLHLTWLIVKSWFSHYFYFIPIKAEQLQLYCSLLFYSLFIFYLTTVNGSIMHSCDATTTFICFEQPSC